jgi:uncharacterized damage-inducible protein DinB
MTNTQTLAQTIAIDFDEEMKNTRKLLERVPMDDTHRTYKPHEKSMSLERLASHVAELPGWAKLAIETELFELPGDFKPTIAGSAAELIEMFECSVEEGRKAINAASDNEMQKTWQFKYKHFLTPPEVRTKVVRSFLNHLVHHRAQLGMYLRLNGIPVPGMYGPSADESF